jgi:hypothetical protein
MTDVFGYVTKVIANGMYEIIEPYHEGFKQDSPSPNKKNAKKKLMKELSLRSSDIVSEEEDSRNGSFRNKKQDKSAPKQHESRADKVFKVKKI